MIRSEFGGVFFVYNYHNIVTDYRVILCFMKPAQFLCSVTRVNMVKMVKIISFV